MESCQVAVWVLGNFDSTLMMLFSSYKGGVVPSLPLEVTIVPDATGTSVTPTIRTIEGRGNMGVVVNECRVAPPAAVELGL